MSGQLVFRNRQRTCGIDLRRLREITRVLLSDCLHCQDFELCIHLIGAPEMTRLNEHYLRHHGSTDVITFDYAAPPFIVPASPSTDHQSTLHSSLSILNSRPSGRPEAGPGTHGEIFISLDDAVTQASRFRTTWQAELIRYIIHGLLHLRGYDDRQPAARRRMRREEDRLLRAIKKRSTLSALRALPRSPFAIRSSPPGRV